MASISEVYNVKDILLFTCSVFSVARLIGGMLVLSCLRRYILLFSLSVVHLCTRLVASQMVFHRLVCIR